VQGKLGVEEGLIYLAGQHAKNNEDSDMPAPFRQRRYFYYLSGFVAIYTGEELKLMILKL
jgi:Xaa-Pro dipeptidase